MGINIETAKKDKSRKFVQNENSVTLMYTTYHLTSAQELNTDILDAIKAAFKSKPITIIVEEDVSDADLSEELINILDERVQENESTYLPAKDTIHQLKKKYGL